MELRAQVYNNICACYLKRNEFENVIRFSKFVLGHSGFERNEKALGRYALAVAKQMSVLLSNKDLDENSVVNIFVDCRFVYQCDGDFIYKITF
jgi:hypothetical protein